MKILENKKELYVEIEEVELKLLILLLIDKLKNKSYIFNLQNIKI